MSYSHAGLVVSALLAAVLVRYGRTPVVMASGRETTYMMLFACALNLLYPFVVLARPTHVTCAALRLVPCTANALLNAGILSKVFVISRYT